MTFLDTPLAEGIEVYSEIYSEQLRLTGRETQERDTSIRTPPALMLDLRDRHAILTTENFRE